MLKIYQYFQAKIQSAEVELASKIRKKQQEPYALHLFYFSYAWLNFSLFFWEILGDFFKFLIILVKDPGDSFNIFFKQRELRSCPYSYSHYKNVRAKIRVFSLAGTSTIIVVSVMVSLITNLILGPALVSRAATYTVNWTSQADFENNAATVGTPTTRSHIDTTSSPGDVKLAQYNQVFNETFTNTSFKDINTTNADWNTASGQLKVPAGGGVVATDFSSKLAGLYGGSEYVYAQMTVGTDVYIGLSNGKFLKYDSVGGTTADLTAGIASFWGANPIYALAYDSVNNSIYLGGMNVSTLRALFAKHDIASEAGLDLSSRLSGFWPNNNAAKIESLAFLPSTQEVYFTGQHGSSIYSSGKYSILTDTASDLSSVFTAGYGGKIQEAADKIYISPGGNNYDPATGLVSNSINEKIVETFGSSDFYGQSLNLGGDKVAFLGSNVGFIHDFSNGSSTNFIAQTGANMTREVLAFDPANQQLYFSNATQISKYSVTNNSTTNITPAIVSAWGSFGSLSQLEYISSGSLIFMAGYDGGFSRRYALYDQGTGIATDITNNIAPSFTAVATDLAYDVADNSVYLGGSGQLFNYNIQSEGLTDLTSKLPANITNNYIYSLHVEPINRDVYIGGGSGAFARYNKVGDNVTDLTTKFRALGNWSTVRSIKHYPDTNQIYLVGDYGLFYKYDVAGDSFINLMAQLGVSTANYSMTVDATGQSYYITSNYLIYKYSISGQSSINLSAAGYRYLAPGWGVQLIAPDRVNQVLYLSGRNGGGNLYYLCKYDLNSGIFTNIEAPIKTGMGLNNGYIRKLNFDPATRSLMIAGGFVSHSYNFRFIKYNVDTLATVEYTGQLNAVTSLYNNGLRGSNPIGCDVYSQWTVVDGKLLMTCSKDYVQVVFSSGDVANAISKLSNFLTWGGTIYSQARDTTNNVLYIGMEQGRLAKYDIAIDTMTDLTYLVGAYYGNSYNITSLAFDSVAGAIYVAAKQPSNSMLVRYNIAANTVDNLSPKITPVANVYIGSLAYDPNEKVIYFGDDQFAKKLYRYNTPGYTAGGAYATADAAYNLSGKLSSVANANFKVTGLVFDQTKNVLYMNTKTWPEGQLARYNTTSYTAGGNYGTADTVYDLSAKVSAGGFSPVQSINAMTLDETNQRLYFTNGTTIGIYNTDFYTGAGTYPTADTVYSLGAKTAGINTDSLFSIDMDKEQGIVYFGGYNGRLVKYSVAGDSAIDLTIGFNFNGIGNRTLLTILFNPEDHKPYVGGEGKLKSGIFGGSVFAQSNNLDPALVDYVGYATLTANDAPGAGIIKYYLSNDGGADWTEVSKGVRLDFSTTGGVLKFKIEMSDNAVVNDLSISYGGYYAQGSITAAKLFAGDGALWGNVSYSADLNGQVVRIQTRSAATEVGLNSAEWSVFATTNPSAVVSASDEWLEIGVQLQSLGTTTPVLHDFSVSYVVNMRPEVQNVTAVQDTDGVVQISYEARDIDTESGTFSPNGVMPSFQYSTNNGSTWNNITAGLGANDMATKTVEQVDWTTHTASWDARQQLTGVFAANAKIRAIVDDKEPKKNIASSTSVAFIFDVKTPLPGAAPVVVKASGTPATIELSVTDDSDMEMRVGLTPDLDGIDWSPFAATTTLNLAEDPEIVYVQFRDAYKNTSAIVNVTTPETPVSLMVQDTTNMLVNPPEYRLFFAWKVAANPPAGFKQYIVLSSTDGANFTPEGVIDNRSQNYFSYAPALFNTLYYYRVAVEDNDGNISYMSVPVQGKANGVQDAGEGGGGMPATPPVIANVATTTVYTTETTIEWETDLLSDSRVEYITSAGGNFASAPGKTLATMMNNQAGIGKHRITLTGLSPNTTYYYIVKSTDLFGNTGTSKLGDDGYSFRTLSGPVISQVTSAPVANGSVKISWKTNVAADTQVYYSTANDLSGATNFGLAESVTEHQAILTGLTVGGTYYYYVKSDVAADTNMGSYYQLVTSEDLIPPSISSVGASVVTDQSALITWQTDETANSRVEYTTNSGIYTNMPFSNSNFDLSHSVVLTGLASSTTYYFRVSSSDASGNSATSSESQFTTFDTLLTEAEARAREAAVVASMTPPVDLTPPTISQVVANAITDTQALINWTTNEAADSKVEFTKISGDYTGAPVLNSNLNINHAINLSGLTISTPYFYRVTSKDAADNSSVSAEYTFTTSDKLVTEAEAKAREDLLKAQITALEAPRPSSGGGTMIIDKTDKTAPIISSVNVLDLTSDSASIVWNTNEEADASAEFGNTTGYGDSKASRSKKTNHKLGLTNLIPETTYHYRVSSADNWGNLAISQDMSFTTPSLLADLTKNEQAVNEVEALAKSEKQAAKENLLIDAAQKAMEIVSQVASEVSLGTLETTLNKQYLTLENLAKAIPGPIFSGEPAVITTANSATIAWRTDKDASSLVAYASEETYAVTQDKPEPYGQVVGQSEDNLKAHVVKISDLKPETVYHYQLRSKSKIGPLGKSRDFTFRTKSQNLEITNYAVQNITNEKSTFKWLTNLETDSAVKLIPYRGNNLAIDEAKTINEKAMTTLHEITIDTLESGVVYEITLSGKDAKGQEVSKVLPTYTTSKDNFPPQIINVQTDSAISPGKEIKIQTIISWTTNEPAVGRVLFEKGISNKEEFTEKTAMETNYTKKHVVVITKFDPGAVYSFKIESIDSAGNSNVSKTFTILTPRQKETVFQLILKNFESTFGWMNSISN